MKKTLYLLFLSFLLIPSFSFNSIDSKEGAIFGEDATKAVLLLNIKDLLNNKPALGEITKFEKGFFKDIQSILSKEDYSISLQNKILNQKYELIAFDIAVHNKRTLFIIPINIDNLLKNGQSTAIFIDKKTREVISVEASSIKF